MTVGSTEVSAPLLGQVVAERYFVEEHLGEGGMGTVYRARHITLEKKVALKVLHGEFSRKQDLVDRFLQEAKAASSIRNEHVIDITDFGITSEGFVFFAMEHLEGKDLHSELKRLVSNGELLPWPRAQEIFLQVCEALAAAHDQGIIHRDLKPENIFLVDGTGREDYVKLLDFGIAKVQSPTGEEGERKLTKTGMLFGTPEYMAPEQARGEKPDHRVDVYAMGCLLFQFLAGTVPFKADSFMAILTQHMIEPVPEISVDLLKRSGAPTGVLGIVEKALAKDREQRFATMRDLAEAVASVGAFSAPGVPATGTRNSRETALVSGRKRPTTHGNWTGSIRELAVLEEDEEQAEAVAAAHFEGKAKSNRVLIGAIGALLLAGGGFAALSLGGGDSQGDKVEQAAPEQDSAAAPTTGPATAPSSGQGPTPADNGNGIGATESGSNPKDTAGAAAGDSGKAAAIEPRQGKVDTDTAAAVKATGNGKSSGPDAKDPAGTKPTRGVVAKDPGTKEPAAKDPAAKDPAAKDPAAKDLDAKDPGKTTQTKEPSEAETSGSIDDPKIKDPFSQL